jgi:hypothetical protein
MHYENRYNQSLANTLLWLEFFFGQKRMGCFMERYSPVYIFAKKKK